MPPANQNGTLLKWILGVASALTIAAVVAAASALAGNRDEIAAVRTMASDEIAAERTRISVLETNYAHVVQSQNRIEGSVESASAKINTIHDMLLSQPTPHEHKRRPR